MKHRLLRLISAWLVMAGLVIGPFVAPSAALATADAAMSMMDDMPCCPDEGKAPQPGKCADCATMLICALKSLQTVVPAGAEIAFPSKLIAELSPGVVVPPDDIGLSPPARPPRS